MNVFPLNPMRTTVLSISQPLPVSLRPHAVMTLALLVWMLGGLIPSAHAQEVRQITFDEAVRIALDQNLVLKQAANDVELQAIQVSRNRADFYPSLSFSGGGSQSYGRNFIQDEGRIVNETTENVNYGIQTGVNVFNGFGDVASLRQARYNQEAADLDYDRTRQTVVFKVMSNYLSLIEQREQIRFFEENLASQEQQLAQIQEFVRVGTRPISDQYQQQADAAEAELNLLEAEQRYQISEVNLIQTLQLDPFGAYQFTAPSIEDAELVMEQYDLQNLLQNAFERRADLRATEVSIQAAQENIRVARSGYWPSIGLSIGYGSGWYSGYSEPILNDEGQVVGSREVPSFFRQFDARRGGNVGFDLTLPIFDRFNTRNNVQQAQVQYESTRLALDDLQQDIAVQVRQAYLDYLSAQKRLDVTEKQEQAAELALEAAQERYNVGAGTLVEVSQANASYVDAASARVQARYDFLFQSRLIEYYLGVLDPQQPLFD